MHTSATNSSLIFYFHACFRLLIKKSNDIDALENINILRQQRGVVKKMTIFADIQYCFC